MMLVTSNFLFPPEMDLYMLESLSSKHALAFNVIFCCLCQLEECKKENEGKCDRLSFDSVEGILRRQQPVADDSSEVSSFASTHQLCVSSEPPSVARDAADRLRNRAPLLPNMMPKQFGPK